MSKDIYPKILYTPTFDGICQNFVIVIENASYK